MDKQTDQSLLKTFKSNPHKGFDMIVQAYQERLYWHVRKMVMDHDDANDIMQNVLIKVWKGLANFRADSGLFTWLYRIATNETLTFIKQKKNKMSSSLTDLEGQLSGGTSSEALYTGDEIQTKLQLAVQELPDKQRLVFNMRYFDEMKYQEMSHILKTSEGALKASYHHAVKKIEAFVSGD
ncbi:MAG: sigma-70 family RNA polymerase sigma factor [Flavobacteriales bacterium]|nr:sigma-70 family RNA polymerase sigma factor [Flavobacteriales bacterium]